ncbi:thiamine pyrophosphate-dependent enzyme [Mycolicibacterium sp. A43C]
MRDPRGGGFLPGVIDGAWCIRPWSDRGGRRYHRGQFASIPGDGKFLSSAEELETAACLFGGYTPVIMRDNTYDICRFQEQQKSGRTSGLQLGVYDITRHAAAFDAAEVRVGTSAELENAFAASLQAPGCTVIDVRD